MQPHSAFHLACYSASIAQNALLQVNAVPDGIITVQNNSFLVPKNSKLLFGAGVGVTLTRGQLQAASLRYVSNPATVPIMTGAVVSSPQNIINYVDENIILPPVDEVAWFANQASAGAEVEKFAIAFGLDFVPAPSGKVTTVRGTCAITGTTTTWTNGPIVLDQTLPQGMYSIVGMDVVATNIFAARLGLPACPYRPGVIGRNAFGSNPHQIFRDGTLGQYGSFMNANLPSLDIICLGACTTQEVYLDLVRIQDYSPITTP